MKLEKSDSNATVIFGAVIKIIALAGMIYSLYTWIIN